MGEQTMGDRSRSRSPPRETRDRSRSRGGGGGGGYEKGIACRWNERGFGFIKPNGGGEDIFAHVSTIKDGNCLREGAEVEYKVEYDGSKGKHRTVEVIGGF